MEWCSFICIEECIIYVIFSFKIRERKGKNQWVKGRDRNEREKGREQKLSKYLQVDKNIQVNSSNRKNK